MQTLKKTETDFNEWHGKRFEANSGLQRKLGIELEFPLVSNREERFGQAVELETVQKIYKHIAGNHDWDLELGELEISKAYGDYRIKINAEAGFSTLEMSMPPASSISHADEMIGEFVPILLDAAESNHTIPLGYGIQPVTTQNIGLISSRDRSSSMSYLKPTLTATEYEEHDWRLSGTVSSSVQFHISATSAEDAMRLMNVFNGFAPEFLLLSANSRIAKGEDSGKADIRSMFYQIYDKIPLAAGIAPRFGSFDEYMQAVTDIPLLLLVRDGRYAVVDEGKHISFSEFMHSTKGVRTISDSGSTQSRATFEPGDMDVHESMVRWEARAKGITGTVEFRICSMQQSKSDILALGAAVLGIASNLKKAESLVLSRTVEDAQRTKEKIALLGARSGPETIDFTAKMLDIAKEGLISVGENPDSLSRLYERLEKKVTPSDLSLGLFEPRDVRPFIESIRFDPYN